MVFRESYDFGLQTSLMELTRQFRSSALTGCIRIRIKGNKNQSIGIVAQLCELAACQVATERAGCIAKAGLPEDGKIEEAFHEDNGGSVPKCFPRNEAALDTRQESMRRWRTDAAPVQIDDSVLVKTRKDDAVKEAVMPLLIYQTEVHEPIKPVAAYR